MKKNMTELFKSARRVSVPIMAIRSADQAATVAVLKKEVGEHPMVQWDAAAGVRPLNESGAQALAKNGVNLKNNGGQMGFVDACDLFAKMPRASVAVVLNAHRQLESTEPAATASSVQAVANLRDVLKRDHRMLVLVAPSFTLPTELRSDVALAHHALPDSSELQSVLKTLLSGVEGDKFKKPSDADLEMAVRAVSGLSSFAAEQEAALSLRETGMDLDELWERKRVAVEATPGLKVYRGRERFADIVGMENVKAQLELRKKGRTPVGVVLVLDEVDKVFANVEHDTTGVRMDQVRTLLTEMEDNEWEGMLLAGIPGAGKTLVGKAFGNELGVPTVFMDLGAMEGSLVGQSEERIRHAVEVIKAIGGGHAYVIATSNNATVMRPELQRRMTEGFFFVDLMSPAERMAAWKYYINKYELNPKQPLPDDQSWSAAEIRNCARKAWNSQVTLLEASRFIVPVAQARASEFDEMRKYAHGRYLDAGVVGKTYHYSPEQMAAPLRSIQLTASDIVAMASLDKES